jgi:hypothetical protein
VRAVVGAGISGYFSVVVHNYIYSGIGALFGYCIGVLISINVGVFVASSEAEFLHEESYLAKEDEGPV